MAIRAPDGANKLFFVETFLLGMEPLKFHMNLEGWRSGFGMVPLMLKP